MRELANMICGAVLSRIESTATFRLGAPHVVAGAGDSLLEVAGNGNVLHRRNRQTAP